MLAAFQTGPRWLYLAVLCVFAGGAVHSAQAQREKTRPAHSFAAAVQLYQQGLYPSASSALSAFRASHPTQIYSPQALYLEAKSALAQGYDERTRRLLNQLQREHPAHPRAQEARLGLAQRYLKQGNTERAKRQLQEIAAEPRRAAEGARALFLLGRTERKRGNLKAALRSFNRARTEYPEAQIAPAALYATGVTQVRLERYDQATSSFEALGERYPDSPFSQNLGTILGEVYYRLDRFGDAATELRQRLPQLQGTERARAQFLLGECFQQLGQRKKAIKRYRRVLKEHPNSPYVPSARYGLAWQHYASGDHEAAASAFLKVRNTNSPLAPPATYYEAVNRALLGERTQALDLYRTFSNLRSEGRLAAEAQYEIGLLLYQKERYEKAADAFQAAIESSLPPARLGKASLWLGNAYLASGRLDRALKAYNQAIEQDAAGESVKAEVRFQKAWSLYRDQRYSEAASAFASLAEAYPETSRGRKALFWGADSYYQQDNYARARALLRRYLKKTPEDAQTAGAHYALAWTHFKQRRFEGAARRFRRFLNAYDGAADTDIPYRQDARLRLADCYFALKRYEDAIAAYKRVDGKGNDYALYQAGKALYYSDQPSAALETLRRFVERYPNSPWRPDALYRIADIHFQQQNYEAARAGYRQLLNEYPDHERAPDALYALGDAHYNAGQMSKAVQTYRRVLERYPESSTASDAASGLFFALNAAGQQDRAPALIDSIAASAPGSNLAARLRFQRARAAYQSGQSKRALKLFREFVRTSSMASLVPEAYYYLGLLYADLDRYTEAKNYLRQLVDQYPQSEQYSEGALRLGEIYLDQEQYKQAAKAYRAAAEGSQAGNGLRAQARYGQSMALLQLGRTGEAESLLSKILSSQKQGPLQASAQLGLGRIREQQGRTSDARRLYRAVVSGTDSETGAEALYRLGRLLRKQGQPRKAVRELERMPSLFAGYPEWQARALLEQARAHQALDNPGQAVQLYDEVVSKYPGTPFADTAREEKKSISSTL
ncbi:tetratricopeptide repeat protein [Salinibacter sp.]|uniref:tetratricopeptide repeat protein n=1 Tax=Salinibacter sp. TaxID=2065818 RepID=UPI0035D4832B